MRPCVVGGRLQQSSAAPSHTYTTTPIACTRRNSSTTTVKTQAVLGHNIQHFVTHAATAAQYTGAHITTAATAAAHAVVALFHSMQASIDLAVLGATTSASFKLFLVCVVVGWLLQTKRIPNSTASVLSQVSFQLLIPCMLFIKVATALSTQPDLTLLFGMLAITVGQVAIGTFWGLLLSPLVDGEYPRHLKLFGWHPQDPPKAVQSIASSVSNATGIPLLTPALLPQPPKAPAGFRELVAASCAFGNSFTLPAVFFLTLLPPALVNTALAHAALFLLGWSPLMWSVGFAIIEAGSKREQALKEQEGPPRSTLALPFSATFADEPLWMNSSNSGSSSSSSCSDTSGTTSSSSSDIASISSSSSSSPTTKEGFFSRITKTASLLPLVGPLGSKQQQPTVSISFDEDDHEHKDDYSTDTNTNNTNTSFSSFLNEFLLGFPPLPTPQTVFNTLKKVVFALTWNGPVVAVLKPFFKRSLNPPVWGILGGMALGLTSLGRHLLAVLSPEAVGVGVGSSVGVVVVSLPPELHLLQSAAKSTLEVVELMASATLAMQTLVLAASLLQRSEGPQPASALSTTNYMSTSSSSSSTTSSTTTGGGGVGDVLSGGKKGGKIRGVVGGIVRALTPVDAVEARALGVLSLVRFVLMPVCTLFALQWAISAGWLGPLAKDPIFLFVVAVESVMPSAQNLIILLQLHESTRSTAPAFARMLLKLYAYAVLPVTLWVTFFASRLSILSL